MTEISTVLGEDQCSYQFSIWSCRRKWLLETVQLWFQVNFLSQKRTGQQAVAVSGLECMLDTLGFAISFSALHSGNCWWLMASTCKPQRIVLWLGVYIQPCSPPRVGPKLMTAWHGSIRPQLLYFKVEQQSPRSFILEFSVRAGWG